MNITGISEQYGFAKDIVEEKNNQILKVKELYDFDGMKDLRLPTTKLDLVPSGEGIGYLNDYINFIKPGVVLMPDYMMHILITDVYLNSYMPVQKHFVFRLLNMR